MSNFNRKSVIAITATSAALALGACATYSASNDKLRSQDTHFPIRMISDVDASKIKTFRADTVIENNCLYAVNVRGKAPSRKYVLTWPAGSKMEFSGKKLQVVSSAARSGQQSRSVGNVGQRMEFSGVLKENTYKFRQGYHKGTAERDCGSAGIARVVTWKTVG